MFGNDELQHMLLCTFCICCLAIFVLLFGHFFFGWELP